MKELFRFTLMKNLDFELDSEGLTILIYPIIMIVSAITLTIAYPIVLISILYKKMSKKDSWVNK